MKKRDKIVKKKRTRGRIVNIEQRAKSSRNKRSKNRVRFSRSILISKHTPFSFTRTQIPSTPRPPEEFEKTLKSLLKNLSTFSLNLSTNLQISHGRSSTRRFPV
ncbi:unnamed protein product [Lactuca virosa]|uniref:Uncharacterized protein n=1 Tax=Lactuca virosa TaxID=75947 RepID=A0AAU9MI02_9ASTR|nr:unnamed protein product [Lactuca virosa]